MWKITENHFPHKPNYSLIKYTIMKTFNFKNSLGIAAILFSPFFVKAQTPVHCCTVIEVTDGYYSDKVWMITEPGTTDGFDNGWDGYKFLSTATYVPQIYDNTADGTFQVSSFPTIENNSFAFRAGDATEYTMKFTHYDITYFYPGLYLVDLMANDTIDVYANASTYKFTASKADLADRFKFITKLPEKPVVVVPPVVEPPVVLDPTPEVVVDPGVEPGNDNGTIGKDKKDKKDKKINIAKKVKIRAGDKKLAIENPNKVKATIRVVNARNGKVAKQLIVQPETVTIIDTNVQSGQYVIQTTVETDNSSTTVLLQ